MEKIWKPTREEVLACENRTLPDLVGKRMEVLFCGINPGLYTAAIQRHFGRPGNRFWRALHLGGFTQRVFSPFETKEFTGLGYGVTNLVARATTAADSLTREEFVAGVGPLVRKVRRWKPGFVAILGVGAYRAAFGRPEATVGEQEERLSGARVWVLPNPSGLNAHYPVAKLGEAFAEFYQEVRRRTD